MKSNLNVYEFRSRGANVSTLTGPAPISLQQFHECKTIICHTHM